MLLAIAFTALFTTQPEDESCRPDCRDGFVCQEGTCISACNPACGQGERCTTSEEAPACVPISKTVLDDDTRREGTDATPLVPADTCRPACAEGETCLETSKGFRCLSGTSISPPARSRGASRAKGPSYRSGHKNTRKAPPARSRGARRYKDTAKAPAIVLGSLSILGGVVSFAAAASYEEQRFESDPTGVFIASGVLSIGLGLWGVIGGATSGYKRID